MHNKFAVWFSRVVWLGIVCNLLFVAEELFAANMVNVSLGVPVTGITVWNVAHGAMVLDNNTYNVSEPAPASGLEVGSLALAQKSGLGKLRDLL
jgi:hypothetical protein